ncbi:PKD domain-containing protein [Cellulomonas chitinilytica]|uniref:PKD domain-containing protein n=1 Tax=Cellulomonas chitinilytica TaxID=398759 RepID=UPI001940A67B|nr:PKD domain-containing protein [Cellulomonas chitinilytica]
MTLQYWSATAPVPPPDPAVLAREAVSEMALQAIRVGIAPSAEDGAVGLVGMPNWMWIDRPDQQTFGPITRTASTGGWSVTATARVASVSWDMGDGQIVTCRGAGTPYSPDAGRSSSPDCGHTYTAQGQYAVQATSHWVVTWAGIGRTGTIRLDLRESVPVTIGEVQVLRQ